MPRVGNGGHATAVVKSHYPKNLIFISRQDCVAGVRTCLPRMTIEPRAPLRLAQRSSRWAIPGAMPLCHTGSERCSPLERRQHAFAATGSSEYVRAYSATTKRMEPIRLLKAIIYPGNVGPNLGGVSGDGDPRSGPGLSRMRTGLNLVSDIDISQLNQSVLS